MTPVVIAFVLVILVALTIIGLLIRTITKLHDIIDGLEASIKHKNLIIKSDEATIDKQQATINRQYSRIQRYERGKK
jgi:hypothetical protein